MSSNNFEMSRRTLLGGTALAAMTFGLAACGRDGSGGSSPNSARDPLLALGAGTLSYACCLPTSGAFTTVTNPWAAAMRYAVDEKNQAGGLKIGGKSYKVDSPLIDEGYAAAPALASAQKFFSQGGRFIGGLVSEEAPAAILGINEQANAFISSSINGLPALSNNNLRFFHDALNQATGSVRAHYAYDQLGLRKIATIELKNSWGASYQETFAAAFTELGGEIVARDYMQVSETDFTSRISAWKSKNPDGIYIIIGNNPGVTIATQATQLGFDTQPFLLEGAWDPNVYMNAGASFIDRCHYLAQHPYSHTTPEGTALAKRLYDEEKLYVTNWFWQGYDSTRMVLDAMELADSTDPRDVIESLPAAVTAGKDKWLIKAEGTIATKEKGVYLQTPVWMSTFRPLGTDFVAESPLVAVDNAAYGGTKGWLPEQWEGYTSDVDQIKPLTSDQLQALNG